MVRHWSSWPNCWILATVSGIVEVMDLPVCLSSLVDLQPALNQECHSDTHVWFILSSPKHLCNNCTCLCHTLPKIHTYFVHNHCSLLWSIAKSPPTTPNKRMWKVNVSTHLCEIEYINSQDMLLLPSTVASYYYCCPDSTNHKYFGCININIPENFKTLLLLGLTRCIKINY